MLLRVGRRELVAVSVESYSLWPGRESPLRWWDRGHPVGRVRVTSGVCGWVFGGGRCVRDGALLRPGSPSASRGSAEVPGRRCAGTTSLSGRPGWQAEATPSPEWRRIGRWQWTTTREAQQSGPQQAGCKSEARSQARTSIEFPGLNPSARKGARERRLRYCRSSPASNRSASTMEERTFPVRSATAPGKAGRSGNSRRSSVPGRCCRTAGGTSAPTVSPFCWAPRRRGRRSARCRRGRPVR